MKKGIVVGLSVVGVLVVLMGIIFGAYFYTMNKYNKKSFINNNITKSENINKEQKMDASENKSYKDENIPDSKEEDKATEDSSIDNIIEEKEVIQYKEVQGITNILLVGTDEREDGERTRSDTMMILTIDNINSKVKITSILRDTYAKIPGYKMQKLNHSYRYGGIDLLRKSLENTFEMNIDYYAIVNFYGFKDIVDEIGGLELTVSEEEKDELNRCIVGLELQKENFFNEEPTLLEMEGTQHMNGQQVLAYSRMRKIGKGSFDRVERQREVVTKLLFKLKETSIIKYPAVADKIFDSVKTNIPFNISLNMAYTVLKNDINSIEQLQVPPDKLCHGINNYLDDGFVFIMDEENVNKVIHDFVFENIAYNPDDYSCFDYENSIYYVEPVAEAEENELEEVKEKEELEEVETEIDKLEDTKCDEDGIQEIQEKEESHQVGTEEEKSEDEGVGNPNL